MRKSIIEIVHNRHGFPFPAIEEYANLPALIIIFAMDGPWI
jgi:hypothetical protein